MFSTLLICLDLMIAANCNFVMVTPIFAVPLFIQLAYLWANRDTKRHITLENVVFLNSKVAFTTF